MIKKSMLHVLGRLPQIYILSQTVPFLTAGHKCTCHIATVQHHVSDVYIILYKLSYYDLFMAASSALSTLYSMYAGM